MPLPYFPLSHNKLILTFIGFLLAWSPGGIFAQHAEIFEDESVYIKYYGRLHGLRDSLTGEVLVEPSFTSLYFVKGNRFLVAKYKEKWGLLSVSGKVVIPVEYDYLNSLTGKVFIAKDSTKGTGILDSTGKVLLPLVYKNIFDNDEELFLIRKQDKWGACLPSGEIIIPVEYDQLTLIPQYVEVRKDNMYGLLARSGKMLLKPKYSSPPLRDKKRVRKISRMGYAPLYDKIVSRQGNGMVVVSQRGRRGMMTLKGNVILPMDFDQIFLENGPLLKTIKGDASGLFDLEGKVVMPLESGTRFSVFRNYILWYSTEKTGILSSAGTPIAPREFDDVIRIGEDQLLAKKEGWYAYVDYKTGQPVSENLYTAVSISTEFIQVQKGPFLGLLNRQWKVIIPPEYEEIGQFKGDWAPVKKEGMWGAFSKKGEELVSPFYEHFVVVGGELVLVRKNKKWGILDQKEEIRVPVEYQHIHVTPEWWLAQKKKSTWCVFDQEGRLVTEQAWESLNYHQEGLVTFETKTGWGLMNAHLTELLSPVYEEITFLTPPFLQLKKEGKYGLYDRAGKQWLPFLYDQPFRLLDSFIVVSVDHKFGLVDYQGEEICPARYDQFYPGEEQVRVAIAGKWGIIALNGEAIVPLIYDKVEFFQGPFAEVELNGKKTLVRRNGKEIQHPKYEDIFYNRYDVQLIDISLNGLKGLLDLEGNVIAPCEYSNILPFDRERAIVVKEAGVDWVICGVIDVAGKLILPVKYDEIFFGEEEISCNFLGQWEYYDWSGKCMDCSDK